MSGGPFLPDRLSDSLIRGALLPSLTGSSSVSGPFEFSGGTSSINSPLDFAGLYAWFDGSDASTITLNGNNISRWDDKSGNGYYGEQATAANQPLYDAVNNRVIFDLVNDELVLNGSLGDFGNPTVLGWLVLGTEKGTAAYRMNMSTAWRIGPRILNGGLPGTSIYQHVFVEGDLTESERQQLIDWVVAKGATESFVGTTNADQYWRNWIELQEMPKVDLSSVTKVTRAWLGCTSLTTFPSLNFSSCTNFEDAWRSCSSITSFPAQTFHPTATNISFSGAWRFCNSLVDFAEMNLTGGNNFTRTWEGCSSLVTFPNNPMPGANLYTSIFNNCTSLTNFPPNIFNGSTGTTFTNAFINTNLSSTSIDNILVSIESNGTYGGTFNQSGGSAPTATGEAAIDALRARGWTVTVTGGY